MFLSSEESFSLYHSSMPWPAVPFDEESRRQELATVLGVQGIPTLVLLDSKGNVITDEGRVEISEDPEGIYYVSNGQGWSRPFQTSLEILQVFGHPVITVVLQHLCDQQPTF
ncbi:hypothetical protein J437_LFUL015466 [Ladona fulva]|uniref:Thioredoxin-like fold domain-containing protein n=1 Tax=Ladona fulva TaxID=123851 RepID=A0A8K0KKT3_LADFU|nr:hypothetical protein J437_LFUL015466 [Ladona fulva]